MAFDKLTEYSATNASNTSVGDVDVTEGMLPSNVNNAIREIMTHQKEAFGSGTPLYVDQTNNRVGIGSSAPSRKLELNNGGTGALVTFTDGVATNFTFKTDGSSVGTFGTEAGSTQLAFMVANSEAARFDGSRNLLFGKTALGTANDGLQVKPAGELTVTRDGNHTLILNRKSSDGNIALFQKDGTTVGSIGTQNWGIGTSSPTVDGSIAGVTVPSGAKYLHIHDADAAVLKLTDPATGSNRGAQFGLVGTTAILNNCEGGNFIFGTGNAEKARITASSTPTILVGCTVNPSASAPGSMVSTTGAGSFTSFAAANTASTHAVFGNLNGAVGTIQTTNSTTAYNTSSDRRLKSNIEDAASASDKIDAIQVRQFDWNVDDSHQDYGLIAQELQPIEPLAVTGDADSDEMMGVDYSKLVPMLIKEIQELRGRVAALEAS